MTQPVQTQPFQTQPPQVPGLDPLWSRRISGPDGDWHVLDTGRPPGDDGTAPTLVCVHGNPTWSYLWRRVLAAAPAGWRVVAVDQLGMGWSDRPAGPRSLAQRIDDLDSVVEALGVTGPVALLAHDWGGPIGLAWAQRRVDRLLAVVLTNTAVAQPPQRRLPAAIRLARSPVLRDLACRRTPAFVRAATAASFPPLPREIRDAFASPYMTSVRRQAVSDFVAGIPLEPDHPGRATLDAIGAGMQQLREVPSFLVWGLRDPVFHPGYLADLIGRLPHADVQRYPRASHLVLEDAPEGVEVIWEWLQDNAGRRPQTDSGSAGSTDIRVDVSQPERTAMVELTTGESVTFADLAHRVDQSAWWLAAQGVGPGQRVAVLLKPGIRLTTVVYAIWRLGAVVVLADAGLGLSRLTAALRGAGPSHVVGDRRTLAVARLGRISGRHVSISDATEMPEIPLPQTLSSAEAAVLFTSGATGPPKGVVYSRERLSAQAELIRDAVGLNPEDRFVAAFAPFALYGPVLGMPSVVPNIDVTAPHTLTAAGLAEAVEAINATVVFAAPAALRTIARTASDLTTAQRAALSHPRLLLSAGAPVSVDLLRSLREVLPAAEVQTPYGMTEAMPVATHDPLGANPSTEDGGVCVGPPVPGVSVAVAALDGKGSPATDLTTEPGVTGEVVVYGPHLRLRYDRAWKAQRVSDRPSGWHRTGDVGHLDRQGQLWVEGRLAHVVTTADGPVTPYPLENRIRAIPGVADAAVVGVGPPNAQVLVVVLVPAGRLGLAARVLGVPTGSGVLAPSAIAAQVRRLAGRPVAAVLARDWLPVDVRHASKVDRSELAQWADEVLHAPPLATRLLRRLPGRSAPRTRSR